MEEEEGRCCPSKMLSDKSVLGSGEVDYKTKAGTAWSHNFLNQKPWHPLSYPNQRRKWIAEQTHAQRQRRAEEVAREFAQEQDFFRQTALVSKKEKEKMEMMKAVSFMYVRPPGYNAESAKAAEIADERKKDEHNNGSSDQTSTHLTTHESRHGKDPIVEDKKKRPKDVFGRALPTEEEFEALKNAPRLETGVPARVKPFAVEIRNVRCVRCSTYGHQSGDRECPLKDAIMPNDEIRLKRDDPLTTIIAQTDSSKPLNWELKQRPGMSPPRGGFRPDDPNQQIVAEDIFDEYGGFLSGGDIPSLLLNLNDKKSKKHLGSECKPNRCSSSSGIRYNIHHGNNPSAFSDVDAGKERRRSKQKQKVHHDNNPSSSSDMNAENERGSKKHKVHHDNNTSTSSDMDAGKERRRSKHKHKVHHHNRSSSSSDMDVESERRSKKHKVHHDNKPSTSSDMDVEKKRRRSKHKHKVHSNNNPSSSDMDFAKERGMAKHNSRRQDNRESYKSESSDYGRQHDGRRQLSSDYDSGNDRRISRNKHKKSRGLLRKKTYKYHDSSSDDHDARRQHRHR